MTVQEYIAEQTERIAAALSHYIGTTQEDKLYWKPEMAGSAPTRSILEQISECIGVNHLVAQLLRGEHVEAVAWPDLVFADDADAQDRIKASAAELAAAIRALHDEDLTRLFKHPRAEISGANLLMMPYRNMAYHAGQINFFQILYGDAEFHLPPTWR